MKFTVVAILISISYSQGARILSVFPFAAKSHLAFTNAVIKSLSEAGHEITVITPFPKEAEKENYTLIIDSSQGEEIFIGQTGPEKYAKMTTDDIFQFLKAVGLPQCKKILNLKEIQNILKSKERQYDVLLTEIFVLNRCFYLIAKKMNIPIIGLITMRSWIHADWEMLNIRHPVIIPNEMAEPSGYETFSGRLYETYNTLESLYYYKSFMKDTFYKFHQSNIKEEISFDEFMNIKPSLAFINAHSTYFPRPQNPDIIEIGGIHDIQKFLDGAERGVILFTFGSVVRAATIPRKKIQAFVEAFAEIPQRVIWKYEEKLEGLSSNVMLSEWLPQSDILAHKNVVAFISHCGQAAIHESIHYGVPLISCPLFTDQFVNADIFENLKIALHLDYDTIIKDSVLHSLNEIINNTKYYENMKKISKAFKDRPMTPQQTVVYWTEYVIRNNGTPYFTTAAAQLNWFQYFLLDIICFVLVITLLVLYINFLIIRLIYRFIKSFGVNIIKNKID